jgi:hypothetical protein
LALEFIELASRMKNNDNVGAVASTTKWKTPFSDEYKLNIGIHGLNDHSAFGVVALVCDCHWLVIAAQCTKMQVSGDGLQRYEG